MKTMLIGVIIVVIIALTALIAIVIINEMSFKENQRLLEEAYEKCAVDFDSIETGISNNINLMFAEGIVKKGAYGDCLDKAMMVYGTEEQKNEYFGNP